ncbi:MAG: UDP-N-acetylmuramate--L-alanine ligase [Saprospiraceae bacterium]
MPLKLNDLKTLYFIGIGGIGMSALARYFLQRGAAVHGYDKTATVLTRKLEDEGMIIHYIEDLNKIPADVDLVVFTPAIPASHLELQHFQKAGLPIMKRAEVLGLISRNLKTIAVAGTHGKTTTSSIVSHVIRTGGVDSTAFLGGIAQNLGSNYVGGKGEWMVVEADEFDRSFLHLTPDLAIILSMDPDHLDIYGAHDAMKETFAEFAGQLKAGGQLFVQADLPLKVADQLSFGIDKGDYFAYNERVEDGCAIFDFKGPKGAIANIKFAMPGRHNITNACAAIAVAQELNVSAVAIKEALASFKGIKRRFERVFDNERVAYIDDYAHHPTELRAAIDATRQLFPERKITGIFQPHLYSRTKDFSVGFAEALDGLDEVLLMDIYPAREEPIPGVSSEIIFDNMTLTNRTLVTKSTLMDVLVEKEIDVLLTLGAGDIDTFVQPIKKWLEQRP